MPRFGSRRWRDDQSCKQKKGQHALHKSRTLKGHLTNDSQFSSNSCRRKLVPESNSLTIEAKNGTVLYFMDDHAI
jgi:hypothetical protein